MKFKVYSRRFVNELIAIGEETVPEGFRLADPAHPAFDLSGFVRGHLSEQEARTWVSSSDYRWGEWDEVTGPRLHMALAEAGGRERIEAILDEMVEEWKANR